MRKIVLLSTTILASLTMNAQTPVENNDSANTVTVLQDVIVTSNRMELTRKQLPQRLDIITSRDILLQGKA